MSVKSSQTRGPWSLRRGSARQLALLVIAIVLLFSAAVLNLRHFRPVPVLQPTPRPEQPLSSRQFVVSDSKKAISENRFVALSPAESGIDFVHPIDKTHPLKFLYFSGMAAGGLAIGDIDGDRQPDIYVVGGPGSNKLYRQVDDLRFEDVTNRANVDGGDAWGCGATMVDINNDGRLDIYVCNYDSPNLLYVNRGDGTFSEQAHEYRLNITDASLEAVFADYDRDGDLDMYLLTYRYENPNGRPQDSPVITKDSKPAIRPEFEKYYEVTDDAYGYGPMGRSDGLLRNNGDGTFDNVTEASGISGIGHSLSAIWWDYDDDGFPDLFVGGDFKDPDRLYHNNGDGTFTDVIRTAVPHTTWFSMGNDAADLDGDGRLDLLTADMASRTHFKQKTTMGEMGRNREFLEQAVPRQYMRNALLLNCGTERFMEAAYLAGLANTDWTWAVQLQDLDSDGRQDVFVTNGSARVFTDSDIPLDFDMLVGKTAWDIYEDSLPLKERNLAFRNLGELEFQDVSAAWGLDHLGVSMATAHGDLDRDGDLDLVVANLEEPITVYRNESSDAHRIVVRLDGSSTNRFGVGAKVMIQSAGGQQTRFLQPSRGYLGSNEHLLHFGLGEDSSVESLTVQWPSGHVQNFENLDVDREYLIAEPTDSPPPMPASPRPPSMFVQVATTPGVVHQERPFDDYAAQPLLPFRLSQLGPGMAMADVNNDDRFDFFLSGAAGQSGKLVVDRGRGRLEVATSAALEADRESEDLGAVWLDVEADGDLDLYVVSGSNEWAPDSAELQDRLYLNDGRGQLIKSTDSLPDCASSGSVVCAADFDRDGDVDLFVGGRLVPGKYPLTPRSLLLVNDGGKFNDLAADVAAGLQNVGLVTGAIWSDADNDGWIDLLVTGHWGSVKFFRNLQGRLVEQTAVAGLADRTGWWNGIAGNDFDHDGDIDYVVTNFGLNTKYHASDQHPCLLYYGDFDNSGTHRLVEAEYEDETLFPVRGKSCSTHAMPFLANRFETYRDFAAASLDDIYTPQCLDQAYRYAANTLESGVLINTGQARFTFHPLPRLAQIAPGFGVASTEVNGDGHPDIYLVHNFFSPQHETGNMDGGLSLLLLGNGDGTFATVDPATSGLVVPDDASSLVVSDLNGDNRPDFLVGANNRAPRYFASNGDIASGGVLAVHLKGRHGNALASGARVSLLPSNGPQQTAEVYSGSGYLSQSPPVLFFGLGESEGAQIKVRWSDGQETITDVSGQTRVVIQQN